jgi:spermidine/putrescine transport system permease protein
LGNLVQDQFTAARNWPFGSAASMLLLVGTFVAILWQTRQGDRPPSGGQTT